MTIVHEFGEWLFFADTHLSPLAVFGATCLGVWLHIAIDLIRGRQRVQQIRAEIRPTLNFDTEETA